MPIPGMELCGGACGGDCVDVCALALYPLSIKIPAAPRIFQIRMSAPLDISVFVVGGTKCSAPRRANEIAILWGDSLDTQYAYGKNRRGTYWR
jgi:hypothetical protein